MTIRIAKEKRIMNTLKSLPPDILEEVLDFAEYLKNKGLRMIKPKKKKWIKLPTFHLGNIEKGAFDREGLYGGYLDRKLD